MNTQPDSSPLLVDVCVDRAGVELPDSFTYRLPEALAHRAVVGTQVLVPLRRRQVMGYVVGRPATTSVTRLRDVLELVGEIPAFDTQLLALARWMSRYYVCSLLDCLRTIAPRALQRSAETVYEVEDPLEAQRCVDSLAPGSKKAQLLSVLLGADRPLTRVELGAEIAGDVGTALRRLVDDGLVTERSSLARARGRVRLAHVAELTAAGREALMEVDKWATRAPLQAQVLRRLAEEPGPTPVASLHGGAGSALTVARRLQEKGWVILYHVEDLRRPEAGLEAPEAPAELDKQQEAALTQLRRALDRNQSQTFVLHGVTASGKTEVYLGAVEHALAHRKQTIVLVPEISLTAQLIGIFRSRFGDRVAVLHSRLSAGERFDEWRRLQRGEARVALGARSAIFAPCADLGLIVVDEEHEPSYKQDVTPRYHTRTVAEQRARLARACLVLGSATPSLESYYRAMVGSYRLLSLPRRIHDRPLPTISLLDLRRQGTKRRGVLQTVTRPLRDAIRTHVEQGNQVILFLNRRGFSTALLCSECGHLARCDHCDVSLTYHRPDNSLRCHHCDFRRPVPEFCPRCGGTQVFFRGSGTQKVEQELRDKLPGIRVLRMDRDTTSRKGSHLRILQEFAAGKADVLLGTQMVAKGLDFPRVTLVGIISADTALSAPDFRASERAFQLLTQVSGRAGRGRSPGEVAIQTYNPDHFSIRCAIRQDYVEFFSQEMAHRRELPYPPFVHLANLIVSDEDQRTARETCDRLTSRLQQVALDKHTQTRTLGPAPCPLARLRERWRYHVLIRDPSRAGLNLTLRETVAGLSAPDRARLTIDVDAVNLI